MLEKIPGQPYLHKLRVIHIIEADYNLTLKSVIGSQLMWHGEKLGIYIQRSSRGLMTWDWHNQCIYYPSNDL